MLSEVVLYKSDKKLGIPSVESGIKTGTLFSPIIALAVIKYRSSEVFIRKVR